MEKVKVRVLKALPQFIGEDAMTLYGPYEPGDVVEVSPVVAEILVFRGLAERVSEKEVSE